MEEIEPYETVFKSFWNLTWPEVAHGESLGRVRHLPRPTRDHLPQGAKLRFRQ